MSEFTSGEINLQSGQYERNNDRVWFAVYAHSRHEKNVDRKLKMREIDSFLPLYRNTRRWKNGCKHELELPLFPNYLFVHIGKTERARVLEVPGVIGLVGSGPQLSPIPEEEIQKLKAGISQRTCEPHPYLKVGQKVRIRHGVMEGICGVLVRKKNQYRVIVSLDMIMRSVALEVELDDIEPLEDSRVVYS